MKKFALFLVGVLFLLVLGGCAAPEPETITETVEVVVTEIVE